MGIVSLLKRLVMNFGSAAGMITSLKNNNRRSAKIPFENITIGIDEESQGIPVKEISEEQLQEIRDKLKKQRRKLLKERLLVYGTLLLVVIVGIIYFIEELTLFFKAFQN